MEHANRALGGPKHREPAANRASAPALVDNSPRGTALGALVQMLRESPQVQAQHALNAQIADSTYVTAQRKLIEEFSGQPAQRAGPEEEEPLQGQFENAQREGLEDEGLLQGKFGTAQLAEPERAPRANETGLPDQLKSGIEALSGVSMDGVKVHYNSSQPAQLNALAYAQGSEIHIAPGQERHLPHEAWHVVQQAQGRVRPTMQLKDGVSVNDDAGLEHEADLMGERALSEPTSLGTEVDSVHRSNLGIETDFNAQANPNSLTLPTLQAKITIGEETFGEQDDTIDSLIEKFGAEFTDLEKKLLLKGISAKKVLTRFDFQNRTFENFGDLINAMRVELKSDLGSEDPEIDKLLLIHPLENDRPKVELMFKDAWQNLSIPEDLKGLVLENTDLFVQRMSDIKKSFRHPKSDTVLFKSILSTIALHHSGAYGRAMSSDEKQLMIFVRDAYDHDTVEEMIKEYGLSEEEHNSIKAYTDSNKTKLFLGNQINPQFMGYSKKNWPIHGIGWIALESALRKLPNLGTLKLKLTTYRVSRNSDESDKLEHMAVGAQILHGNNILKHGQKHVTSTALTYNYFNNPSRVKAAKGIIAIHGTSGILINPFGVQGFLDGAEILFPSGIITKLREKIKGAYQGVTFEAPVYHLHESGLDSNESVVDDFKFEKLKNDYFEQRARESEMILALIDEIEHYVFVLRGQQYKEQSNIIGELLHRRNLLLDQIEDSYTDEMIRNYELISTIDQIAKMPAPLRIWIRGYFFAKKSLFDCSVEELRHAISNAK